MVAVGAAWERLYVLFAVLTGERFLSGDEGHRREESPSSAKATEGREESEDTEESEDLVAPQLAPHSMLAIR